MRIIKRKTDAATAKISRNRFGKMCHSASSIRVAKMSVQKSTARTTSMSSSVQLARRFER
jgi:hypothetical protein